MALGIEQDGAAERGLEEAVGELAADAYGQQTSGEGTLAQCTNSVHIRRGYGLLPHPCGDVRQVKTRRPAGAACHNEPVPMPHDPEHQGPEFGGPDDTVSANRIRAGSLLVAGTTLTEPTFRRTVIYIVEHNDAGSLGVVINRMSQTAVHNLLPRWTDLSASPRRCSSADR